METANHNPIPAAAWCDLLLFLRTSSSTLSVTEAVVRALELWMKTEMEIAAPRSGYQWKTLFLPTGTSLRLHTEGRTFYADIIGDELVFSGRAMSPRQMVMQAMGEPRNAWRELWVHRPLDKEWLQAGRLRSAINVQVKDSIAPTSPVEAIQLAARSMSEALQTALLLVDQTRARAEMQVERRVDKHRRADDQLETACMDD